MKGDELGSNVFMFYNRPGVMVRSRVSVSWIREKGGGEVSSGRMRFEILGSTGGNSLGSTGRDPALSLLRKRTDNVKQQGRTMAADGF